MVFPVAVDNLQQDQFFQLALGLGTIDFILLFVGLLNKIEGLFS